MTTSTSAAEPKRSRWRIASFARLIPYLLAVPIFFIAFDIVGRYLHESPFVQGSQIQYSGFVLQLYIGVLSSTAWTTMIASAFEDREPFARFLRGGALVPLGVVAVMLWHHSFHEGRVDKFGLWLTLFAALAVGADLVEFSFDRKQSHVARSQLVFVDLPVLVGALTVVLIKYSWYSESSDEFIKLLVKKLIGDWGLPDKGSSVPELLEWLRVNFWHGMTSGVLMIQLISAQLVGIVIRTVVVLQTSKGDQNGV